MRPSPERRLVILTEGHFSFHDAKTAMGVLRYSPDKTVAILDSTIAGRNASEWLGPKVDVPAVATLDEALALKPDALLIGIAPTGGKLPEAWRATILQAIRAGLNILSGLHMFLGDDPEFSDAAHLAGVEIIDYRRPPERKETAVGRLHGAGKHVVLMVGTDCAVGKMSVALELDKAAKAKGLKSVFVPTGQTGMMIAGWGVAVDRVISDFLQGTCEHLVEQAESMGDWILVEGQGSIDHPAYSSVTLGLIHGCTPHAMILVHKPGLPGHDWDHVPDREFPLLDIPEMIHAHELIAGLVAPSKVVGIAFNTSLIPDEAEAHRLIEATAAETGLPCADPVRFGATGFWDQVQASLEARTITAGA